MSRIAFRLIDALVLALVLLLPFMLMLGAAEGTPAAPSFVFWLLLVLPLLFVPWLWSRRAVEERRPALAGAERAPESEADRQLVTSAASDVMHVERVAVLGGVPYAEGRLRIDAAAAFKKLEERLRPGGRLPLIESAGDLTRVFALPRETRAVMRRRSRLGLHLLLFGATILTTLWAGAVHSGVNLLQQPAAWIAGLPYAAALLAILGVHEMGHYVVARLHRVEVTLPYFIPVPMGLGTLGAFIQMKSLIKSRRAIFDIGIAGPLAGLAVALPALYFGMREAVLEAGGLSGAHAGSSILLALVYQLGHGGDLSEAATTAIRLTPVGFAGWIGLLVTALNLLPVGQLDGGHIAYGLFGRRHAHAIGVATFVLMLGLGLTVWPGLLTWALLVALIAGFEHMPALDDVTQPDAKRFAFGAFALLLLVLIVAPLPGATRAGMMLDCPYV